MVNLKKNTVMVKLIKIIVGIVTVGSRIMDTDVRYLVPHPPQPALAYNLYRNTQYIYYRHGFLLTEDLLTDDVFSITLQYNSQFD